jgi:hypothetical protein
MYYTGIGSRYTPQSVLTIIQYFASEADAVLRSGGTGGADSAFEAGAPKSEIYLPWNGFRGKWAGRVGGRQYIVTGSCIKARAIAQAVHPAWSRCSDAAKKFHTRNVYQVLGQQLDSPSNMLICWTPGGADVGGAASAIKLARLHNVPVINLAFIKDVDALWAEIDKVT